MNLWSHNILHVVVSGNTKEHKQVKLSYLNQDGIEISKCLGYRG